VITVRLVNRTAAVSLSGMFPPLPTPFKPDGALDLDTFRALLRTLNAEPLAGYLAGGSNGEFSSLSMDERLEVVAAAREVIPKDRLLIAGSGAESTRRHHRADQGDGPAGRGHRSGGHPLVLQGQDDPGRAGEPLPPGGGTRRPSR
jgi:hypothetical protein